MRLIHQITARIYGNAPGLLAIFLMACVPAMALLTPAEPDPLARIRDAAKGNVQACSATGETLCEQVAPKIVANAQGDSPLAENLRQLTGILQGNKIKASEEAAEIGWAIAAFHDAGLDAHVEKYASTNGSSTEHENVIAEYRGRESPEDWVLVGAHLGPLARAPGEVESSCDAAALIEAARDISLTGVHPRISLRFVLFTGDEQSAPASLGYVRLHRAELDHDRAAIFFQSDCRRLAGYLLNGRPDLESGVREAMKPIESMGGEHFASHTFLGTDGFDFLLEGIPALTVFPVQDTVTLDSPAPISSLVKTNLADLKRNTAIVAVTAFGIAERSAPLGPRQSRAEIESLLKTWDLETQMKIAGLWPLWESGERGRMP
jgi:hypothetical protein